jgi:DNA-binding NtrC family response regulator
VDIFIVDLDWDLRRALRLWLSAPGVVVSAFSDPEKAEEFTEADFPDVLIAAFQLPKLSGVELIRRMRLRNPCLRAGLVVGPLAEVAPHEHNVCDFVLRTPCDPQQLLQAVGLPALRTGP